ncbi:FAD-dependent oxidoreductase [Aquincola tertiaricarbonis]|uniref:FAD-dependent oxidoreductase n=1 Tax=Aquincola tertiaricarbonis TaxID=391953 RepID=A0ABY4S9B0_AQUTE|nr:FAD-dependent oxidoreductase [Aquincola tertiaricarbonis]URI09220.1 FAD-dependent oxidoreductase [Aquincola tertiaricarbonis]
MKTHTAPAGQRHACVIGAGIVGAATAQALAERGWRVTLVDAQPQAGRGESLGNGAQLSYSYVEPLATPDALKNLPKWLLSPTSPLRWRPQPRLGHARWLSEFIAACQWPTVRRTSEQLLALAAESRHTLHRWLAAQPGRAEATRHTRPGKLVIYRKPEALAGVQRQIDWQRAWGCEQAIVGADEVKRLEPALAATGGGPIAFGVWTASEEVIDAARLAVLLAESSGATLRLGQRVTALQRDAAGRVVACLLAPADAAAGQAAERLEADAFVLAAGPATLQLLRPLGGRPPIEPIKGYSVSLPIVDDGAAPRVSITDNGRKLVHARLGDRLRVAGFAELIGMNRELPPRRIEALCQAVRETFPGACRFDDVQPWTGLRPATPSGRPQVGPTRWPGLWLNAGHGALGLTLACGSASLLADLMAGETPPLNPEPFRVTA